MTFVGGLCLGAAVGAASVYFLRAAVIARYQERCAHLEAQLAAEKSGADKLRGDFRLIAQEALERMEQQFSSSAMKDFRQATTEASASLGLTKQQIESSVTDMRSRLEDYQKKVQHFEEERQTQQGKLEKSIEQVLSAEQSIRMETSSLKRALTESSGVRGSFGERVLLELLEQSDLVRGVNFDTQQSFGNDDTDGRPDFIIYLPGGKRLAIDSKEVAAEYRLSPETDDPAQQKEHYQKLVQNIRTNLVKLSRKEYQAYFDREIGFVVMFIPSEGAIRAAFSTDPQIFQDAVDRHVILASPMTIIPLIQLIRHSWQQHKLADNARELGMAVEVLGDRLYKFMEHLLNVGKGIKKASDSWDQAVGSWDSKLSPQIEKTKALGGKLKDAEPLTPIGNGRKELNENALQDVRRD